HTHDEPFERLERAHELLGDQHEGRAHAVGEPGARRRGAQEEPERHERAEGPAGTANQNVTDGWWTPNTPRSRSQISPSVTCASPWYRYAASWISRCMNGIAAIAPPSSSIFRMYARAASSISSVRRSRTNAPPRGSTTSATPDSWARICWVLSARRTRRSSGSGSAS